nr:sulfotransferase family 2 domain-containing protein [Aestuariivirga litoralis]
MQTARAPQDFFVSVHIPKTAGTALGQILNRAFGHRVLMDYAPFETYASPDPLIREGAHFIGKFYRGIHGHYNVKRHLANFPDAQYIACVRHPVERIISQYLHELNEDSGDAPFQRDIREGRLSVIDFAAMPGVGDAMYRHLDGLCLDRFMVVLVTESLPTSLRLLQTRMKDLDLSRHFGTPPVYPVLNSRAQRKKIIEFDQKTRSEIYLRAPQDVEIYRRATELLNQGIQRHLQ